MAAPKGFKKVDSQVKGFWKPSKVGSTCQGIVMSEVDTKGADGKPNVYFTLRVTSLETGPITSNQNGAGGKPLKVEEGMLVGIGGKTVQAFLRERIGQEVFMVYTGLGKAKPGQSAPKLYDCFEREGAEA